MSKYRDNDFWLSQKMSELYGMLNDIHCKPIDNSIEQIIVKNKELIGCKSLDAIHIATAIYFKENSREQDIVLYSFDKNMLTIAKQFGFQTN